MKNNKIIKFILRNSVAISACVLTIAFSIGYWVFAVGTTSIGDNMTVANNLTINGTIVQENWTAPALLNGWVNINPAVRNPAGYFRDKNGIVHLRGAVKSGAVPSIIFTLPVGYRPAYREIQPVISANILGQCIINANGDVTAQTGNSASFYLDGITFRASGY